MQICLPSRLFGPWQPSKSRLCTGSGTYVRTHSGIQDQANSLTTTTGWTLGRLCRTWTRTWCEASWNTSNSQSITCGYHRQAFSAAERGMRYLKEQSVFLREFYIHLQRVVLRAGHFCPSKQLAWGYANMPVRTATFSSTYCTVATLHLELWPCCLICPFLVTLLRVDFRSEYPKKSTLITAQNSA